MNLDAWSVVARHLTYGPGRRAACLSCCTLYHAVARSNEIALPAPPGSWSYARYPIGRPDAHGHCRSMVPISAAALGLVARAMARPGPLTIQIHPRGCPGDSVDVIRAVSRLEVSRLHLDLPARTLDIPLLLPASLVRLSVTAVLGERAIAGLALLANVRELDISGSVVTTTLDHLVERLAALPLVQFVAERTLSCAGTEPQLSWPRLRHLRVDGPWDSVCCRLPATLETFVFGRNQHHHSRLRGLGGLGGGGRLLSGLRSTALTRLELHNNIGAADSDVGLLVQNLKHSLPVLRVLNLSENPLSNHLNGVARLAAALAEMPALTDVRLARCGIGRSIDETVALTNAFQRMPLLQSVDLAGNMLGNDAEMLGRLRFVRSIDLADNGIDHRVAVQLRRRLGRRVRLDD
jgi:hypothetical protein